MSQPVVHLDGSFKPQGNYDLIRVGRNHDGGYLVDRRDIKAASRLISLGICDDWSFESDFLNHRNVPLDAFDGTIDRIALLKMLVRSIPNIVIHPTRTLHSIYAFISYNFFFRGNRHHHKQLVGFDRSPDFISLQRLMDDYAPDNGSKVFLKIDIERWEYRILEQLAAVSHRISGMVIEFHDLDLHLDKVRTFLQACDLQVAHVHCNNYAPSNEQGIPLAIELTLSSHTPLNRQTPELPHSLDQPNFSARPDYAITFR